MDVNHFLRKASKQAFSSLQDSIAQQRAEPVAQPGQPSQYLSEEETPARAEELHVIGLFDELQGRFPLLYPVAVIYA